MADVKITMTSEADQVKKDYEDLARRAAKLETENAKLKRTADRQADAFGKTRREQGSMFSQGLAGIGRMAAGYASVTQAIGLMTKALEHHRQEQEKAVTSMDQMEGPRGRLNQVATDQEDLQRLQARADTAAVRYGFTREQAATAMFSARSEGFEQSVDNVFRFAGAGADVTQVAGVAGQIPTLFEGAVTPEEAIASTYVAAKESRLDFGQIAQTMPAVAQGTKAAGGSSDEAFALASVMASQFASGSQSATSIAGLGSKFGITTDERLQGKGIVGGVEALQQMSEADRREFLKESKELNEAYNAISAQLPQIRERQAKIEAERVQAFQPGSETMAFIQRGESDIGIRGVRRRRGAEIREEIANERQFGREGLDRDIAVNQVQARLKEEGAAPIAQFGAAEAADKAQFVGAGAGVTGAATVAGAEIADLSKYGLMAPTVAVKRFVDALADPEAAYKRLAGPEIQRAFEADAAAEQAKQRQQPEPQPAVEPVAPASRQSSPDQPPQTDPRVNVQVNLHDLLRREEVAYERLRRDPSDADAQQQWYRAKQQLNAARAADTPVPQVQRPAERPERQQARQPDRPGVDRPLPPPQVQRPVERVDPQQPPQRPERQQIRQRPELQQARQPDRPGVDRPLPPPQIQRVVERVEPQQARPAVDRPQPRPQVERVVERPEPQRIPQREQPEQVRPQPRPNAERPQPRPETPRDNNFDLNAASRQLDEQLRRMQPVTPEPRPNESAAVDRRRLDGQIAPAAPQANPKTEELLAQVVNRLDRVVDRLSAPPPPMPQQLAMARSQRAAALAEIGGERV